MTADGREIELARLRRQVRWLLGLFMVGLVLSGITAFPLLEELRLLCTWLGLAPDASPAAHSGLAHWLLLVREGLTVTYARYPFIGYGTDWLAFGHIIIALFFIAPWREPGRHLEVIRVGLLACVLVLPLALIDCSFGLFGLIPLWLALRAARRIEKF
jgi:hypothetical protein